MLRRVHALSRKHFAGHIIRGVHTILPRKYFGGHMLRRVVTLTQSTPVGMYYRLCVLCM